jgi:hypothetical protein
MTTPDHRPYLTATDLRTPEDVLAWLDAMALTSSERIAPIQWSMAMAHARLRARLDRERRQACRRAARIAWREFAYDLRRNSGHNAWVCKWCIGHLADALAFRAAARTP